MAFFNFLLVDDEARFVDALAERLRKRGYGVVCAYSTTEALDCLENGDAPVDVVVLDINMPGISGIKAIEHIKRQRPLVEVVMLTCDTAISSVIEAMKCGAFTYLTKPCELDALIAVAARAADRKKERERKILGIRMQPYISEREREALIAEVFLNSK